jgi:hypothetical protein
LLRDYLPVNAVIIVVDDPIVLECLLAVYVQKKVERFGQRTAARRTEKIGFDLFAIGVATPDDHERLEQIPVDMCGRAERSC